jgi:hypothetical protein
MSVPLPSDREKEENSKKKVNREDEGNAKVYEIILFAYGEVN